MSDSTGVIDPLSEKARELGNVVPRRSRPQDREALDRAYAYLQTVRETAELDHKLALEHAFAVHVQNIRDVTTRQTHEELSSAHPENQ